MITPRREWECDQCGTRTTTDEDSLMVPTPPYEWIVVDVMWVLPPRTIGEGDQRVKVGRSREVSRKAYCPSCKSRYV